MNLSMWRICVKVLFVILTAKSEDLCSDIKESAIVKTLAASLGITSFTFVQNQQNVGSVQKIRDFPANKLLSSMTNLRELDTILNDKLVRKRFFEKRTILITKEKLNFTRVLDNLSDVRSTTWLVFLNSIDDIQHAYIPINTNFFTVHCTPNTIVLNKAYNIKPGLRLSVKNIQIWTKGSEVEGTMEDYKKPNIDFEKRTLNWLFVFGKEDCERNTTTHVLTKVECFHQQVVQIIAEKLNYTVKRIQCPNRQYPYNFPNGSLSDMFLILLRGEADLSSGSYIVNRERMRKLDFAWPVFTTRSMMYIKYESATSSWRAYLRPIEIRLWKVILSWIIATGLLLQFFDESRKRRFKFRLSLIVQFIKTLFCSLQVFCNQGQHNISRWTSNRIVFMLSFFLCVSLYQSYCAFLISSLTVTTPIIPFTNLDEFLSDRTYKIMTLKKGFHNYFVKHTLNEYGENGTDLFWDKNDFPDSTQGGINKLCAIEKLTYVEFRENVVQSKISCKIVELPKPMFYESIGLGFPKNSPYNDIINHHISALRSTGILHRMRRYLLSYMTLQERDTSNEQFLNVQLWHVGSIFFILGVGTIISVVILFLEIYCNHYDNRKTSQKHLRKKKKPLKFMYLE